MKLTRVTLENFRSFAEADLDLPGSDGKPLGAALLVGANGSGKSSVLAAISIELASMILSRTNQRPARTDSQTEREHCRLFPGRETAAGEVVSSPQEHRDQERNREACPEKLVEMLRQAAEAPAVRRPTRPTKGSRRRRLADKKRQSARKSDRKVRE